MEENKEERTQDVPFAEKQTKAPISRKEFYIVAVILGLLIVHGFKGINQRTERMERNVRSEMNSISDSVHHVSQNVRNTLEEQGSILEGSHIDVIDSDITNRKVILKLSASPKEYTEKMKLFFQISCDGSVPVVIEGKKTEGAEYTAELEIPLCDTADMTAVLDYGNIKKVQAMGRESIKEQFVLDMNCIQRGSYSYRGKTVYLDETVSGNIFSKEQKEGNKGLGNKMEKLEIVLFADDKEVKRIPAFLKKRNSDTTTFDVPVKAEIPLEEEKPFEIRVEGKDSLGFSYHQTVQKTIFNKIGSSSADLSGETIVE